jgi:capsular polysaccharide biosynthesis protein
MTAQRWVIDEPQPDEVAGTPPTMIASITYLWAAMRRRWRLLAVLGALGLVLGAAQAIMVPPAISATTTLYLSHPDGTDPASAMQTDVSILRTRTVAERTLKALGLRGQSPADLQDRTTAVATTSSVLTLTVSADTRDLALRSARTMATTYLDYRATQLNSQAAAQVTGYQSQINAAKSQINALTKQYDALSNGSANQQTEAADVLSRRSQLSAQVISLQQQVDSTTLAADSVTAASHVLDPATVIEPSAPRRVVMLGLTGAIGGLAVGSAIVLFSALTSTRLRRREEVALALGVPVQGAATRIRPGFLHGGAQAERGREVLVRALSGVDKERRRPLLVTVGDAGLRDATLLGELVGLEVHPLDFDAGADELAGRADQAVLVVRAGKSSAEQLNTAADLLRSAGVELAFAVLIGTDRTDESSGRLPQSRALHAWRPGA